MEQSVELKIRYTCNDVEEEPQKFHNRNMAIAFVKGHVSDAIGFMRNHDTEIEEAFAKGDTFISTDAECEYTITPIEFMDGITCHAVRVWTKDGINSTVYRRGMNEAASYIVEKCFSLDEGNKEEFIAGCIEVIGCLSVAGFYEDKKHGITYRIERVYNQKAEDVK